MSDVLERFMRYVQVDSQSDPKAGDKVPSTERQHDMARLLAAELLELGCVDACADEHAYVTATMPASAGSEDKPALVLCSHIDTSPDAPAAGVKPHIVHYEGGDLLHGVVDGASIVTTPVQEPALVHLVGEDIVCSDGSTLLGGDDKAGVAEIVALAARLSANPELPHPTLKFAFVPDEEIGHGASLLDLDSLGAAYGYTVDASALGEINFECFNACEARVRIHGVMVHPGTAKDIMVNAITVMGEFLAMLPPAERPEHTEGYDGFYHPLRVQGDALDLEFSMIVRDFDAKRFEARQRELERVATFLNGRYGEGTIRVEIEQTYRNMAELLADKPFLVERAMAAFEAAGVEPFVEPIRGGTDGAQLTFRGLPCPNLSTGAFAFHSVREFIPVSSLETMVDVLENLVASFA